MPTNRRPSARKRPPADVPPSAKVLTCPICRRQVTVGGPIAGQWVVQAHSPQPGGIVMCAGFNQRISVQGV